MENLKNYEQSKKLDNVCYDIRGPVMDEANRMAARTASSVLKLNIGNPAPFHLYAPDEILVDMIYNLRDSRGLLRVQGICSPRARRSCSTASSRSIPNVGIDDIYTGNGASELITMAHAGPAQQRRRGARARAGLPAVDGVGDARRRQGRALHLRRAVGLVSRHRRHAQQGHRPHEGHRRHQPEQPHRRALSARGAGADRPDRARDTT